MPTSTIRLNKPNRFLLALLTMVLAVSMIFWVEFSLL